MLGSSEEEVPKKRATRKRAASTSVDGIVRAPRRRAPRKSAAPQNEEVETPRELAPEPRETRRKAPTELRERKTTKNKRRNQLVVTLGIFAVGVGASAIVGFSDRGTIDVNKVVEERNERIRAGGGNAETGSEIIPVQNQNIKREADGGLRPADPSTIEPPAPVATTTASSTATSTDAVASSTEPVSEEGGEPDTTEATTTETTTP